ncbi:MAG: DUF4190 domain-containing protein [Spirochaetales bacterium]|nr:DUF4190 domain-containing protein [Spirochaetales bacterium]
MSDTNTSQNTNLQPHRGTTVLVLGILGFIPCCGMILGIIAWVLGSIDLKKIDAGLMDPSGRGNTNAGKILGIISTILWILVIILYIVIFVIMGVAAINSPEFADALNEAIESGSY